MQAKTHGLEVHAFLLMPNHFHLIATFAGAPIDVVMKEVIGSSTRIINTRCRRWGRIFGGRYNWSLIREPLYFAHALKYVYRNPVKAGLCEAVGDYEFSTFAGLIGLRNLPVPILQPREGINSLLPEAGDFVGLERWLNQQHRAEENEAIRVGLRKREFEVGVRQSVRRKVKLEKPI